MFYMMHVRGQMCAEKSSFPAHRWRCEGFMVEPILGPFYHYNTGQAMALSPVIFFSKAKTVRTQRTWKSGGIQKGGKTLVGLKPKQISTGQWSLTHSLSLCLSLSLTHSLSARARARTLTLALTLSLSPLMTSKWFFWPDKRRGLFSLLMPICLLASLPRWRYRGHHLFEPRFVLFPTNSWRSEKPFVRVRVDDKWTDLSSSKFSLLAPMLAPRTC